MYEYICSIWLAGPRHALQWDIEPSAIYCRLPSRATAGLYRINTEKQHSSEQLLTSDSTVCWQLSWTEYVPYIIEKCAMLTHTTQKWEACRNISNFVLCYSIFPNITHALLCRICCRSKVVFISWWPNVRLHLGDETVSSCSKVKSPGISVIWNQFEFIWTRNIRFEVLTNFRPSFTTTRYVSLQKHSYWKGQIHVWAMYVRHTITPYMPWRVLG